MNDFSAGLLAPNQAPSDANDCRGGCDAGLPKLHPPSLKHKQVCPAKPGIKQAKAGEELEHCGSSLMASVSTSIANVFNIANIAAELDAPAFQANNKTLQASNQAFQGAFQGAFCQGSNDGFQGANRGFAGSNEAGGQPLDGLSQHYSSSDRMQRVAQSPHLSRLLSLEVQQQGVVTALGYHAVLHNFLYGPALHSHLLAEERTHQHRLQALKHRRRLHHHRKMALRSSNSFGAVTTRFTKNHSQNNSKNQHSLIDKLSASASAFSDLLSPPQQHLPCLPYRSDSDTSLTLDQVFQTNLEPFQHQQAKTINEPFQAHQTKIIQQSLETNQTSTKRINLSQDHDHSNHNSDFNSEHTDECGWLPWPKDEDNPRKYSKSIKDDNFLPWPKSHSVPLCRRGSGACAA